MGLILVVAAAIAVVVLAIYAAWRPTRRRCRYCCSLEFALILFHSKLVMLFKLILGAVLLRTHTHSHTHTLNHIQQLVLNK